MLLPIGGWGRSASWSAYMKFNNRNLKWAFLTTRCHYWGVDLPVDMPISYLTIEIWNWHSWPLDASSRGVRSASWSAEMNSNIHISCSAWKIWDLIVEICNCHWGYLGCLWGVRGCWGYQGGVSSVMTLQC